MKTFGSALCMLMGLACGKPTPSVDMKAQVETALVGKTWVGRVDNQPVILTVATAGQSLTGQMQYTYFSKPGVNEDMTITISDSGVVQLTGTRHTRVGGVGGFNLDTLIGKLSADGATLSGKTQSAIGGEWSLSTATTIDKVDPPLDMARFEDALVKGAWKGRMGQKPATLKFSLRAGKLSAQFTFGNRTAAATADLREDGMVILTVQPKPTAQGLVSETFTGQITTDMSILHGEYEHSVQQGFVTQTNGDQWVVQNTNAVTN